jgi:hypothetical protein
MAEFFPRTTVSWRTQQPHALRRLTLSLPQMALLTGIAMRLWRSYTLTHGTPDSWAWVGGTFLAGVSFLFLMCAIHLANFTLKNWIWRAPLFAVLEAATEIVMSFALTALNLEPLGAEMAELSDWLPTAIRIFFWRLIGIIIFAFVLGVVVWILRRLLLTAGHRGQTVAAVHRASVEAQAEAQAEAKPESASTTGAPPS